MSTSSEVRVPRLGITMTEGTLVEWLVRDGDRVVPGTALYVLETDKVENEVSSVVEGTIRLLAEPGRTYPVGEVVAEILTSGSG